MTSCPCCGEEKERIAQHWAMSSCGYPEVPTEKRRLLDGLVLSGATVAGNGNNRHLTLGSTNEQLIEWLADEVGWLCHGVRAEPGRGRRETMFNLRTPAHPLLNRYERWDHIGEAGGRTPPAEFTLTPGTARVWWALSGGLQWSGDYDSQRQGTFSAKADGKARWIQRVLRSAGFEPTRVSTRVQLSPRPLSRWLDWIGMPIPGVTYKWARTKPEYHRLQRGE